VKIALAEGQVIDGARLGDAVHGPQSTDAIIHELPCLRPFRVTGRGQRDVADVNTPGVEAGIDTR
jgi:hypothetical protein